MRSAFGIRTCDLRYPICQHLSDMECAGPTGSLTGAFTALDFFPSVNGSHYDSADRIGRLQEQRLRTFLCTLRLGEGNNSESVNLTMLGGRAPRAGQVSARGA